MDAAQKPATGTIAGFDLTASDAPGIRDFYASVVGWRPEPVDMGEYADFAMATPATGDWVAGVCHARGGNADLPPQWLVYIAVDDLDQSLRRCREGGGTVLTGVKGSGDGGWGGEGTGKLLARRVRNVIEHQPERG